MQKNLVSPSCIWPLWLRLLHWLVAACVLLDFFVESGYWHRVIGYVALTGVVARLSLTLTSKTDATRLVFPKIKAIKQHIMGVFQGQRQIHHGHNPLGQYAVYAMWGLIITLAASGWLSRTDALWGEDLPVTVHETAAILLKIMVVLHLLAVAAMSILQRHNLVATMWFYPFRKNSCKK